MERAKGIDSLMSDSDNSCCSPQRTTHENHRDIHVKDSEKNFGIENFETIPAGEFQMGTNEMFYPTDGEGPCRKVWVDEFKISKYAVTNAEFSAFVTDTGYKTDAENYGWSFVFKGLVDADTEKKKASGVAQTAPWWLAIEGASWANPFGNSQTFEDLLDHPVVHVSHNDAQEFCVWAGYKLPTEAQWEKASRGGLTQKLYPWGDELLIDSSHNTNIWQGEFPESNSKEDGYLGTAPVDSFQANNYGLFNTVGNVWEWTADFWSARWHLAESEETRRNPKGPVKTSGNRVLKGGSFMCHDSYCYRYRNSARTFNSPDTSTSHIGFRCVKSEN